MSDELPASWTAPRLEEIVEPDAPVVYGIIQPGPEVAGGVPFVRPTEMHEDGIALDELHRCSPEIAAKYRRAALRTGDVVLAIVGTIGKVAVVPPELDGGNVTQSAVRIRPKRDVPSRYVAYALRSPQLRAQFDAAEFGNAVRRLNVADVRALRIPLAPERDRERIVAKLDALRARSQRAKDALDAVPALLDRLRQSILAAAFRGDLTADWRAQNPDVEPASELLKRIRVERRKRWEEAELAKMVAKGRPPKDDRWKAKYVEPEPVDESELPELPEGWCWSSLDAVFEIRDELRVPLNSEARATRRGEFPYYGANGLVDRIDDYRYEGEYILVAEDGGYFGDPARGVAYLVEGRFWVNNHAHVLAPLLDARYATHALNSIDWTQYVTGTTRGKLTQGAMKRVPVPVAPAREQAALASVLDSTAGDAHHEPATPRPSVDRSLRNALDQLDSAILAAAFRGELVSRDSSSPDVLATGS